MTTGAAIGALALLALALGACQRAPAPASQAAADEARLAAEALEARDWAQAADLYRRALAKSPESLPLHYGLAVAASYLEARPEAIREFHWVLERGEPGSPEVAAARRWLIRVGALASARSRPKPGRGPTPDEAPGTGTGNVEGRAVVADGAGHARPLPRERLLLVTQPAKENFYHQRTDEQGRFRFGQVRPGVYMLTNRLVGPSLWRLRVEVKPGQDVFMDLGPANSTKVRDDFPVEPKG